MIDWVSALAAQDQSLEGLMAKQDLSKKIALLNDVVRTKQQKTIADDSRAEKSREFDIRQKELGEIRDERLSRQATIDKDRQDTMKRTRYNTIHDNLKPGDRMKRGPDFDLMGEFGTGGQFEADPNDPDAMIYQRHQFEQGQAKLKLDEELRKAQEGREKERLKLAQDADKRAQHDEDRRAKAAERSAKLFEQKQAAMNEKLATMPPELRAQVAKEQATFLKTNTQGMMEDDATYQERIHAAFEGILNKTEADAVAAGRMKPRVPVVQPRGNAAGGGEYLSDAEVKSLFPSLPPGARVKRVK